MAIKEEPKINGFKVTFVGNNKKGENIQLKVWIDPISYFEIVENAQLDKQSKIMFLQSHYVEKQEFRNFIKICKQKEKAIRECARTFELKDLVFDEKMSTRGIEKFLDRIQTLNILIQKLF